MQNKEEGREKREERERREKREKRERREREKEREKEERERERGTIQMNLSSFSPPGTKNAHGDKTVISLWTRKKKDYLQIRRESEVMIFSSLRIGYEEPVKLVFEI